MPQKHRVRNWNAYNTALRRRGDLFIYFNESLVQNGWYYDGKKKPGGNRIYSDNAIAMILTIRYLLKLPLRQTQGLIESLARKMDLDLSIPDYSTLSRRAKSLSIKIRQYGKIDPNKPLHLVADSTGLSIYSATYLHTHRHSADRLKKAESWKKLHIASDLASHQIYNGCLTDSTVQDAIPVEFLTNLPGKKIASIRADKAYDKRHCYRRAHALAAQAIIPPMKNAIVQRCSQKSKSYEEALAARDEAINFIRGHPTYDEGVQAWKKRTGYHKRSHIEAVNQRYKSAFGHTLSSKDAEARDVEITIKLNILNLQASLGVAVYKHVT